MYFTVGENTITNLVLSAISYTEITAQWDLLQPTTDVQGFRIDIYWEGQLQHTCFMDVDIIPTNELRIIDSSTAFRQTTQTFTLEGCPMNLTAETKFLVHVWALNEMNETFGSYFANSVTTIPGQLLYL